MCMWHYITSITMHALKPRQYRLYAGFEVNTGLDHCGNRCIDVLNA